jgi:hypothetical protein
VAQSVEEIIGILEHPETLSANPVSLDAFHEDHEAEFVQPILKWLR